MAQVTQVFVERRPDRSHPYNAGGGFMLLSKEGLRELDRRLADHALTMQGMRVLIAMAASADFENRVRAGQKDLASHLRMDQSAVSKAVRNLVELGFVLQPEWSRGPYRINPTLLWQGSAKTLKRALEERVAA